MCVHLLKMLILSYKKCEILLNTVVYLKQNLNKKKKTNPALVDLFDPGNFETVGDECISVGHLLNDLTGGLSGSVSRLCVHKNKQRVCLLGAPSNNVLQGGDVLEGVERYHTVIVVPSQQEHCGVLNPITFWNIDVVEWGVPGEEQQGMHSSKMSTHAGDINTAHRLVSKHD